VFCACRRVFVRFCEGFLAYASWHLHFLFVDVKMVFWLLIDVALTVCSRACVTSFRSESPQLIARAVVEALTVRIRACCLRCDDVREIAFYCSLSTRWLCTGTPTRVVVALLCFRCSHAPLCVCGTAVRRSLLTALTSVELRAVCDTRCLLNRS